MLPAGGGDNWREGDAVAGVLYSRPGCDGDVTATRQEAKALAHLTIVCDGMYSSLRGTPATS